MSMLSTQAVNFDHGLKIFLHRDFDYGLHNYVKPIMLYTYDYMMDYIFYIPCFPGRILIVIIYSSVTKLPDVIGHENRNRNRKLLISRAPTKAKSQEPAYSQALNQNK